VNLPADELDTLLHRYLDDALTPAESESLNRLLETDAEVARRFAELSLLHAQLRLRCAGRGMVAAGAAPDAPARRIARWLPAAVAAGALVAAGLTLLLLARPSGGGALARAEAAGEVALLRGATVVALRAGAEILPGDRIRTGSDGRATVAFAGEFTTLFVPADSCVGVGRGPEGGKRVVLEAGRLRCAVAPQPAGRPMIVTTPHAETTVLGTAFALRVAEGRTDLGVDEGRVQFAPRDAGREPLLVAARQAATADERGVRSAPPDGLPWKEALAVDFRRGEPLPSPFEPAFCLSRRMHQPDRAYVSAPAIARLAGGMMRLAVDARPETMGLSELQWRRPFPGDLRVEVTLPHQPGRQLTITLDGTAFTGYRFNFQPGDQPWRGFHMDRLEVAGQRLVQRDSRDILDIGRSHRIVVERTGRRFRAWVDAEERIDTTAPPLPPDPDGVAFSVGATFTTLDLEAIRVLGR
jgi:ferric-dicitrate binding protein FerR (iron transport regulator)